MLGRTIIITAALATAAALPATAHAGQDLRSPDTRDAAAGVVVTQDLRSPDARDAARGIVPVEVPAPTVVDGDRDGFHWGDAGIGAAGTLGLAGLLGGLLLIALQRRRRDDHVPVAGAH